jgi:hypothetical protein
LTVLFAQGLELASDVISAGRAHGDAKIQFRAVFSLMWLLKNRADLTPIFRKCNALHTQLRFSQNSSNVELKEAADECLGLMQQG